jgi:GH24 family phage-related lysozyme (muramidase)
VWTIGYGHVAETVVVGLKISQALADRFLREDLETAASRLAGVVKDSIIAELTEHQYSALLSFVFNVGCGSGWQIWKLLNARQFDQVPAQLNRFVNAGGHKLQGLVNRRAAEVVLWSTDEPGSAPDAPSSAVTRAMPTPPTPTDAVPAHKSATILTGALGVASTLTVAVKSVSDALEPYKEAAPLLGQVIAGVAMLGAGAAVAVLALNWLKKRRERTA